jgi:hypoxanthine-DNA glycosylase
VTLVQSPAKTGLPPIVAADARLLILGSLPGDASLASERYYAHPRNQFWRLLEPVAGEPLHDRDYDQRLQRLRELGIGLWDTIGSAVRRGSLDGALRAISANPLRDLVDRLPELQAIAFNGATASRIGRRSLVGTALDLINLPSSSPANTVRFADKAAVWAKLVRYRGA